MQGLPTVATAIATMTTTQATAALRHSVRLAGMSRAPIWREARVGLVVIVMLFKLTSEPENSP